MVAPDAFRTIKKILALQTIVVGSVSTLFLVLGGIPEARSALLGGLAALLPNAYFAYRIVGSKGRAAKQLVRVFYMGESVKIIITALLFAVIFQLPDIRYVPLFASFMAVLVVFWFALLMRKTE